MLGAQRLPRLGAVEELDAGLLLGHGLDGCVAGERLCNVGVAENLWAKQKSMHILSWYTYIAQTIIYVVSLYVRAYTLLEHHILSLSTIL